jgi:hypothetical protein
MSAVALPADLKYGKVTGRFVLATGDTLLDVDHLPDANAASGTVTFTPAVDYLTITSSNPPVTVIPATITCTVNAAGYITDSTGELGVNLIATNNPTTTPTSFTYRVSIQIPGMKARQFDIQVPADSVTDLTLVSPVATSGGVVITKGDKGDPGDAGPGATADAIAAYLDDPGSPVTEAVVAIVQTELDAAPTGGVESVNGDTGIVVLNLDDIAETATWKKITPAELAKLQGIAPGATANATDAQLRARATHTGTQPASTISDWNEAVQDAVAAMLVAGANVQLTYTDNGTGDGTLQVTATGGGDAETMRDTIGAALVGINGVGVAVNDPGDTITLSISGVTIAQVTGLQTALDAKHPLQTVAATVTAAGAAVANKHNPVNAAAGTLAISLPTGQAAGTQISVEKVDSSTNAVTITGSVRGVGGSTLTLSWQYETILLRADAAGSWWPVAGHKTKTALDAAYKGLANLPAGTTVTVNKDTTTGFWPASYAADGTPVYAGGSASGAVRPTSRADITVMWKGADPSPAIVTNGAAGMRDGIDLRLVTP